MDKMSLGKMSADKMTYHHCKNVKTAVGQFDANSFGQKLQKLILCNLQASIIS